MSKSIDFSNNEWLSRTLRKTKLSPFGVFILFLGINLASTIPVAIYFGAWNPSQFSEGLSSEPSALLNDNLAIPIIFAYFQWIQASGGMVFKKILDEGSIIKNNNVEGILIKYKKHLINKWLPIIASLIGLIFTYWFLWFFTQPPSQINSSWVFVNPAIVWIRAPMMFITSYALVIFVYDLAIIVRVLNELFVSGTVKVEPLHPDGAGGLSPIGHFSSSLGYVFFVLGLAYSVRIINQNVIDFSGTDDIVALIGLVIYLLLSPFLFFLPLRSARAAMTESKNNLLKEVSGEFDRIFLEIRNLRSQNADEIEPYLKRYRQIEETRKIIEKFPVWPFNIENIRGFISLVALPILPALISIIIDLLK